MSTYLKKLVRKVEAQGWRVERNKHLKFYSPDGKSLIVCGCTESDHRAFRNTMSRLRRAGFRE